MECFFHRNILAADACADCGKGLCKECVGNVIYKTEKGRPLCRNCAVNAMEKKVSDLTGAIVGQVIKLIFSGVFIGFGLYLFFQQKSLDHNIRAFIYAVPVWALGGFVLSIGQKDFKFGLFDAFMVLTSPGAYLIGNVIAFGFLGPIFYLCILFMFFLKLVEYKELKKKLENVRKF